MKLFASIEIPQLVIEYCLDNNVPRLDIPKIFEEYVMSLAGFAYYDGDSPITMFKIWCNEENILDDYINDDGPEYDSAGFTVDDRIIMGEYMVAVKAVKESYQPNFARTTPKRQYNSYKSYVRTLQRYGKPMSENMLNILTFGYDRNNTTEGNKKYADMLRRAVNNGHIKRRFKPAGSKGRHYFEYYV